MVILRCHHFLFNDLLIYYHSIILGSERWNNMKLLENKVAIITGGTRGIGFATVEAFLKQGAKVAMCGSRQETVSLAREVGKDNIRVNCVAPGITETDMMAQAPKEIIAAMSKQVPLQRLGQPEDIANAFVFLASDYASYITGAVLRVDGGMLG